MSMYVGEALVGDGNEISHIDLLIGDKNGPVGVAFANALANQSNGHTNLLAVVTPNLVCKPATVMITKVYDYNYEATKLAIKRAMTGEPKIDEILAKKGEKHPFSPK